MKTVLDTNAYAAMRRGHEGVRGHIERSETVVISTVVAGELLFGFRAGARAESNIRDFEHFLSSPYVSVVPVTLATADRYGRIAASLKAKGKPIPSNDIWIAAHCLEVGGDLLSFDPHFQWVDGLVWVQPSPTPSPQAT
jgi:tRNA(fMet)-specific endonuclease VapC